MTSLAESRPPPGSLSAFVRLAGPYWTQPGRWKPRLLAASLALIIIAQVALAVRLNLWSADLFDALERRSTERAMAQIGIFGLILLASVAANAAHLVIRRHLHLDWRRWLTRRVIGDWMQDGRQFQVGLVPGDHGNPDGRIAEDIRISTEAAIDFFGGVLFSLLMLVTFISILWSLSGWIEIAGVMVPGHLVVLAFAYAGSGAVVAFVLGRPLVRATDARQTKEAEFRFGLIRGLENAEPSALARGEAVERGRLDALFQTIGGPWRRQSLGLARLLGFSVGYATLSPVLPILVGTPRFLAGTLSLGGLMQSAQAFQLVSTALSWPIDNLPRLAEWRASVERVLALEDAIGTVAEEAARVGVTAINLNRAPGAPLGVSGLSVAAPDGTALLVDITLQVAPGEHVLVDGDAQATTALFLVIAGIWPWGEGRVDLPGDREMIAVGRRPFLPEGSLHRALAFPEPPETLPEAGLREALGQVGLGHLAARLDEHADWGRVLSAGELQRLSFARLLLRRPNWIVLGDATDALDPASAELMLRRMLEALPQAGVLLIGRHHGSIAAFGRRLSLTRSEGGEILLSEVHAHREAARRPRPLSVVDWLRQGFGP